MYFYASCETPKIDYLKLIGGVVIDKEAPEFT